MIKALARTLLIGTQRAFKIAYWFFIDIAFTLKVSSEKNIPIIINNFNRVTFPQQLVSALERLGYNNIIILDNNSTYPPTLEYYRSLRHQVIPAGENYGHLAFWQSGLYKKFRWSYFAYTDSDVLPEATCPADFMIHFRMLLTNNLSLDKVGFGIAIDNLPNAFSLKDKVIAYEKKYWEKPVAPGVYDAPIDTTFALYRPWSNLVAGHAFTMKARRTGRPYTIMHLPWYLDSANLPEEEKYYRQAANNSSSIAKHEKGQEVVY
jgi:hypothetical protein